MSYMWAIKQNIADTKIVSCAGADATKQLTIFPAQLAHVIR